METIKSIDLWTEQYENQYECFNGAFVDGFENGKIYKNQCQAARELGLDPKNINKVLNGKRNHTGGYHFVWLYKLEAEP